MLVGSAPREAEEQMGRRQARGTGLKKICLGLPIAFHNKPERFFRTKFTLAGRKEEKQVSLHTSRSLSLVLSVKENGEKIPSCFPLGDRAAH